MQQQKQTLISRSQLRRCGCDLPAPAERSCIANQGSRQMRAWRRPERWQKQLEMNCACLRQVTSLICVSIKWHSSRREARSLVQRALAIASSSSCCSKVCRQPLLLLVLASSRPAVQHALTWPAQSLSVAFCSVRKEILFWHISRSNSEILIWFQFLILLSLSFLLTTDIWRRLGDASVQD